MDEKPTEIKPQDETQQQNKIKRAGIPQENGKKDKSKEDENKTENANKENGATLQNKAKEDEDDIKQAENKSEKDEIPPERPLRFYSQWAFAFLFALVISN